MLKAGIEIISTGEITWIPIPNGDLSSAISDFTEGKDWECTYITGVKENGITMFPNNNFYKCNLHDFNQMLLQANDFQYTDENLAVLNLMLEHCNYDCDDVVTYYEGDCFKVYRGVVDMGQVAYEYLEQSEWIWYTSLKNNELLGYFDFKSYGEEILGAENTWLQDKNYKIIVEVYE
jgi:hypothetical protein